MTMRISCIIGFVTCAVFPRVAFGQLIRQDGVEIEFMGLSKTESVAEVVDSLQKIDPLTKLYDSACAVLLQDELGFPEAAVIQYPPRTPEYSGYTAIVLVEPDQQYRLRYLAVVRDSLGLPAGWHPLFNALVSDRVSFEQQIRGAILQSTSRPDSDDTQAVVQVLRNLQSDDDFVRAVKVLRKDANWRHRVVAAAIIAANFSQREEALHVLVEEARGSDRDDPSAEYIAGVLQVMTLNWQAGHVNWRPVGESIRALMKGTNLFVFLPTVIVLTRAGIDESTARYILADGGGDLLLEHLASLHPMINQPPYELLKLISGRDYGHNSDLWQQWLDNFVQAGRGD